MDRCLRLGWMPYGLWHDYKKYSSLRIIKSHVKYEYKYLIEVDFKNVFLLVWCFRKITVETTAASSPVALTDWSEKNEDYNKRNGNYCPRGHNNP